MKPMRAAVIDLGSNSVKILLAEQRGRTLHVHREEARTTRLGHRLALTGKLSRASIRDTLIVLREARAASEAFGASLVKVVGTSALRSATNARDFLDPARKILGQPVRVITGAAEARYAYAGISSSRTWHGKHILALDLGGGSLEFVLGKNGLLEKGRSLAIGCVRLHDLFLKSQPVSPTALADARAWILHASHAVLPWARTRGITLVGCGGTMITLAALHRDPRRRSSPSVCEGRLIPATALSAMVDDLASRSLASIRRLAAIPPARADVITAGALVFQTLVEAAGAPQIGCATLGLRYGLWQMEIAPQPFRLVVDETSST